MEKWLINEIKNEIISEDDDIFLLDTFEIYEEDGETRFEFPDKAQHHTSVFYFSDDDIKNYKQKFIKKHRFEKLNKINEKTL